MAWPGREARPGAPAPQAIADFMLIAHTIARFEPVLMLAQAGFVEHAHAECGPDVEVAELEFDDVWIRDSGPLVVRGGAELVAVDVRFNLWGSKTVPRERYAGTGVLLAERLGLARLEAPFVLEGGAVSAGGHGTLIAVEPSILNENRNPGATRADLEEAFAEFLGIERTIWLEYGLAEDRTDGHADNVAVLARAGALPGRSGRSRSERRAHGGEPRGARCSGPRGARPPGSPPTPSSAAAASRAPT